MSTDRGGGPSTVAAPEADGSVARGHPPRPKRRFLRRIFTGLIILAAALLTPSHLTPRALSHGPGLPKLRFDLADVGKSIASFPAQLPNGVIPYEHGQPFFLGGYLVIPISQEKMYGGFQLYDISDPRHPLLAATHESVDMRETHNVGLFLDGERRYGVFPAAFGIQIWDLTRMDDPRLISRLTLPGILPSDYSRPAWWVAWQAPWIYVAAASQGLYIVDARVPDAPRLEKVIPVEQLGLPRIGSIQAIGTLLVAAAPEGYGVATLDISTPDEPRLLGSFPHVNVYSANVAWDRVFAAGIGESSGLVVLSIADPRRPASLYRVPASDRAGYLTIQDRTIHLGSGRQGYQKLHLDDAAPQLSFTLPTRRFDLDFTLPLGNLVAVSDDEGNGTHLVVHESNPDTTPPVVTMVAPKAHTPSDAHETRGNHPDGPPSGDENMRDHRTEMARTGDDESSYGESSLREHAARREDTTIQPTARFGVVLSDQLDARSLNARTVQLLRDDGTELAALISYQGAILNVAPREPLPPGAQVILRLTAGGLTDLSGNALAEEYRAQYRVAAATAAPRCTASRPDFAITGEPVEYRFHCDPPASSLQIRYGDGTQDRSPTDSHPTGSHPTDTHPADSHPAEGSTTAPTMTAPTMTSPTMTAPTMTAPRMTVPTMTAPRIAAPRTAANTPTAATTAEREPTHPTGTTFVHHYERPGRYQVQLEGPSGENLTFLQIVTRPLTPQPPRRSQQLLLDESHERLLVLTPDANTISVFDTIRLRRRFEAIICDTPRYLIRSEEDEVWVSCRGDDRVIVLDGRGETLRGELIFPRGSRPAGIVAAPHGSRAYLALEGTGTLAVLDTKQRTLLGTAPAGPTPRGLALTGDGTTLYVTRFLSSDAEGEVREIDIVPFDPLAPPIPRLISVPFDPGPDTALSGRGVPNYLQSATISPDGTLLVVPAKKDNIARGLQRDGQPLGFASTVRSMVAFIDLASGAELMERRRDLDNRSLPVSATFSPRGELLYITTAASNTVEVLDAASGELLTSLEETGYFPVDTVLDRRGETLYVLSTNTPEIIVYDVRDVGRTNIVRRLKREITTTKRKRTSSQWMGQRTFADASDRRMSRNGYLSCVVCHLDGEHDGRTWDFTQLGEGLRNTVSLVGRGNSPNNPLHWTGNFDEVQDFERQIRLLFDGNGFLPHKQLDPDPETDLLGPRRGGQDLALDMLADFVHGLGMMPQRVPPPSPAAHPPGDRTRGEQLFRSQELGCSSCHIPPTFTDSRFRSAGGGAAKAPLLHDVGTITPASGTRLGQPLTGLDTPSLRGLALSAPYLHDGSAATIDEVLTSKNPADRHGTTSHLDAQEIRDLIAYLLSLE